MEKRKMKYTTMKKNPFKRQTDRHSKGKKVLKGTDSFSIQHEKDTLLGAQVEQGLGAGPVPRLVV